MVHIICFDWPNTSGNHAGMTYLYKKMQERNPELFRLHLFNTQVLPTEKANRRKNLRLVFWLAAKFVVKYKRGDTFFLTEYLKKESYQVLFAKIIRLFHPNAPVYGIVHLVPEELERKFSKKQMVNTSKYVTQIVTLGSSLTQYFQSLGVQNVCTSFHYVDNEYYAPSPVIQEKKDVTVIVMGSMARDFEQIAHVVSQLPHIHFYICKGRSPIDSLFEGMKNVTLIGYVSEEELKHYMTLSDISLNVMKDTIGSNVICTSMSMGLAMVVSDVGSIRDYCDEMNACFCSSSEDFIASIERLDKDAQLLYLFKRNSAKKAERLSLDNYYHHLFSLLNL